MYEISLVPNIKAEFLKKQRTRNMMILVSIGVSIASLGVCAILFLVMSGQSLAISLQEREIACRDNERDKNGQNVSCNRNQTGTPVMKFNNMETLLTIQDQMKSLDTLNSSRIKFSRIFGLLDVLLIDEPNGQSVMVSELTANFSTMTLSFDAVGSDNSSTNIGYKPLETFKKNASKMYFDYGEYTRMDENQEEVEIPHYCIDEEVINGQLYGIYHKGEPGCEAPMVEQTETVVNEDGSVETRTSEEQADIERVDIYIRRSYENEEDKDEVKAGRDKYWDSSFMGVNNSDYKGYSFKSECLQITDGEYDEEATASACPFLSDEVTAPSSSYGRTSEGDMVLTFSATVPVTPAIFLARNHNMRIIGPSRQNVTDSYVQIRDMFTQEVEEEN